MGRSKNVKDTFKRVFAGNKATNSPPIHSDSTPAALATTPAPDPSGETAVGLKELSPGVGSPKADIIFVHGLRGSRMGSWSHEDICWPRDFLKDDLPGVRVFTFGWDAMIANFSSYASQESLFGHAETLLADLEKYHGILTPSIFCPLSNLSASFNLV